jgi:hypothetical protein
MTKTRRITNPAQLTDVADVKIEIGTEWTTKAKKVAAFAVFALIDEGYWFERRGYAHWGLLSENGRMDLASKAAQDARSRGYKGVTIVAIEEVAA